MEKESFKKLIEEVRDGFVVPAQMKQSWAADMSVLKEIDKICQQYQIAYFADWGTLLGAVRHGGMIPWDDDLDIVMKRADYKRFLEVIEQDGCGDIKVLTYRNQAPDNWMFMGKVVKKDRICFEPEHLRHNFNYPYIASVDIFVLDYLYRDEKKEQERRELCLYLLGVANAIKDGSLQGDQIQNNLLYIRKKWNISLIYIDEPIEMARYLYGKLEELFAIVSEEDADNLCQLFPWGLKGTANIYPKAYYEESIRLPFEDFMMPVPIAFEEMLRARYGEYWRFIKNVGAHAYPNFEMQKTCFEKEAGVQLPRYKCPVEAILRKEKCPGADFDKVDVLRNMSTTSVIQVRTRSTGDCERKEEEQLFFKSMLRASCLELKTPVYADQMIKMQELAMDIGELIEVVKGEGQECIHYLEQYCELLYRLYELLEERQEKTEIPLNQEQESGSSDSGIQNCTYEIGLCIDQFWRSVQETILDVIDVVIFVIYEREKETIKEITEEISQYAASEKRRFMIKVVVINYYAKDYDGTILEGWNDIDAFNDCFIEDDFDGNGFVDIQILNQEQINLNQLKFQHPEIIISTNGYDMWNENVSVNPSFYSAHLRECTDFFIYYDVLNGEDFGREDEKSYHNLRYQLWCPGVMEADCIVTSSETMRQRFVEKLTDALSYCVSSDIELNESEKQLWATHWNRIVISRAAWQKQLSESDKNKLQIERRKKRLLYCISIGAVIEKGSKALEKLQDNLKIMLKEEKMEFCVTTFPDVTEKIVNICPEVINNLIGILATHPVEVISIADVKHDEFDAYYGDGSPYIVKFQQAGKPVMIQNYDV